MKAALYLRVSTAEQAERYSLPAQLRQLAEHCERQGWVYEVYEDAGISGETIEARPAMQRLLKDSLARKVDIVLAVEMERFSRARDGVDLAIIKRVFRSAGVRFGTPAQLFNPEDVEDDFVSGLLGLLASREKQKIVERTSRGRIEAARQGRYVSARAPFGYRRDGTGAPIVYEPEAVVVRRVFGLLAQGQSTRAIARVLNAEAIPTPGGAGDWTRQTILKMLRNAAYGGTAYYGRQRVLDRHGQRRRLGWRDSSQWIAVAVPRIVADDMFRQVEIRLRQNAALSRRNQQHSYLLRSLVRCGVCGHTMCGKFCGRYRYYTCQASRDRGLLPRCRWHAISAKALEALVWEQVAIMLRSPDLILAEARRYRAQRLGQRDEILMRLEYVRKALQDLPQERDRIQTLYREGYATLAETKRHLQATEDKQRKLEDEGRSLEGRLADSTVGEDQGARLEEVVARVHQRIEHLTELERFEVIHAFIDRVIVGQDQGVEIHAYVQSPVKQGAAGFVRTAWQDLTIAATTS